MSRAYMESAKVLSVVLVVLGAAMVVTTLARGGGPLSLGLLLGLAFAALGVGRLRLAKALGSR
jgi:hypothetical protein